jgi:hypothetical protein
MDKQQHPVKDQPEQALVGKIIENAGNHSYQVIGKNTKNLEIC